MMMVGNLLMLPRKMKQVLLFLLLGIIIPSAFATHTDIPYYAYDAGSHPTYAYGTDTRYPYVLVQHPSQINYYTPRSHYDAGYSRGNLYERYSYTAEYEIRGNEYDSQYGYAQINDAYREAESYERIREYTYDRYGNMYRSYDPRYDGRYGRTLYNDAYDNDYYPVLYGSGRIAIEDAYGPVHYNYRGQRYGYDSQGRRFYY